MKLIDLPVDLDKIILLEKQREIRRLIPYPPFDFSGPVGEAKGQIRIPGLGFIQGLFSGQKKTFHGLTFLELFDK